MTWFRNLDPEWQMLVVFSSVIVAVGLLGWLVVSIHDYRAEYAADDSSYREQGHVPPETDPERTDWIRLDREAVDALVDGQVSGRHSVGVATVPVAVLVAELQVSVWPGRHHLVEVG